MANAEHKIVTYIKGKPYTAEELKKHNEEVGKRRTQLLWDEFNAMKIPAPKHTN